MVWTVNAPTEALQRVRYCRGCGTCLCIDRGVGRHVCYTAHSKPCLTAIDRAPHCPLVPLGFEEMEAVADIVAGAHPSISAHVRPRHNVML